MLGIYRKPRREEVKATAAAKKNSNCRKNGHLYYGGNDLPETLSARYILEGRRWERNIYRRRRDGKITPYKLQSRRETEKAGPRLKDTRNGENEPKRRS